VKVLILVDRRTCVHLGSRSGRKRNESNRSPKPNNQWRPCKPVRPQLRLSTF